MILLLILKNLLEKHLLDKVINGYNLISSRNNSTISKIFEPLSRYNYGSLEEINFLNKFSDKQDRDEIIRIMRERVVNKSLSIPFSQIELPKK